VKKNEPLYSINRVLSTGFFTGYFPVMPGTVGTLVGVAIYIFLSPFPALYALFLIPFLVLSVAVSDYAEKKIFRVKDPSRVVIDEIAGFLVAMTGFSFRFTWESFFYMAVGFTVFRMLDILKPFPIRQSQKLEGGLGIVLDDVLAGLFTNLALQFLRGTGLVRF
jgi:phosphatidylglycerophosphatase A